MADKTLDVQGLACPLPVLKAKKAFGDIPLGGTLEVLATDPGAPADFEAFATATGSQILEQSADGGRYRFLIKRLK